MKAYRAEDLRSFTQALFLKESFDRFLVAEAEFRTFCAFSVSGAAERGWFTDEELEEERVEEYISWRKLRPVCFGLIRGKKTPGYFRITFRADPEEEEAFLKENAPSFPRESLGGLFWNLKYENGKLQLISAASMNRFPPDRALEEAWDRRTERFLKEEKIPYERI